MNIANTNIPMADTPLARYRKVCTLSAHMAQKQIDIVNNHDYSNPTPEEAKQNKEAVIMLTLIATLDYFIYDLIDEMEAVGKYKMGNKRNIHRCKALIERAHMVFYRRIYNDSFGGCKQYNDAMDTFYRAINECVALEAPERAYNIIVAVVRLQAECRKRLALRYFYPPSQDLEKIPSLLAGLDIKDYGLDNIIELRVRPIVMKTEYVG